MLPTTRDGWRRGLVLVTGLALLTGCIRADDTVTARAREGAEQGLGSELELTFECLQNQGRNLWMAGADTPALAAALVDCAGTTVLNLGDEDIRAAEKLYRILGSVALSGVVVENELQLTMYTEVNAFAQSGVTGDRVTVGTCWQVTVDENGRLGEPAGVTCSDALVARAHPTEVLDLDEVEVSFPLPSDETG